MRKRFRDPVTAPPAEAYWKDRLDAGWRVVAVEWERPEDAAAAAPLIEVPFGLRIAANCTGLEEDPDEMDVLRIVMATVAEDRPLSHAVGTLNQRGYRTREGIEWTAPGVFRLMPRIVESGPRIMTEFDWAERRHRLLTAV